MNENQQREDSPLFESDTENDSHIYDYLASVIKRRYWFLAVFFIFIAFGFFYRSRMEYRYSNSVKMRFLQSKGPMSFMNKFGSASQENDYNTHVENLKSTPFLEKVVRQLDTSISPEALPGLFRIRKINESNYFMIKVVSKNPEFTKRLANTLGETYQEYDFHSRQKKFKEVENWLDDNLKTAKQELRNCEYQITRFYQKKPVKPNDPQTKYIAYKEKLDHINFQLQLLSEEKKMLRDELFEVDSQVSVTPVEAPHEYEDDIMDLRLEKAKIEGRFGEGHSEAREIQQQIEAIQNIIEQDKWEEDDPIRYQKNPKYYTLSSNLKRLGKQEKILQIKRNRLHDDFQNSYEDLATVTGTDLKLKKMLRALNAAETRVQMFLAKKQEIILKKSATPKEVFLIEKAKENSRLITPYSPNIKQILLVAFGFGLIACWLLEYFDPTIKKSEQITKNLGLLLLGVVPHRKKKTIDANLEMNYKELDEELEPFFRVLGNIKHLNTAKKNHKGVLVISALQNEGKTFAVCNLAVATAIKGEKAIVLDFDLKRPKLHNFFCLKNSPGVSEYLSGEKSLAGIIQNTPLENLDIITAGKAYVNFNHKAYHERMDELFKRLDVSYTTLFIDTSPVLLTSETISLIKKIGKTIIVFRNKKTSMQVAGELLNQLNHLEADIVGAIYNDIPLNFFDRFYYNRNYGVSAGNYVCSD